MPACLKKADAASERRANERQVRETVEAILADIENRGDIGVGGLSIKFSRQDSPISR